MKKSIFLGIWLVYSTNTLSQSVTLPSYTSLLTELKDSGVPSVGIGIIEQGKVTKKVVLGDLKEGISADIDAIFDTASIAKSITTMLTLHLVSLGLFDLDEPLFSYWVDPDVSSDPYSKIITARHVLGHTTGFKNWRYLEEDGKLKFNFKPGEKVQYSGEGFEYLKEALSRKFNLPFEILVRKYIFSAYGMTSSHVIWHDSIDGSKIAIAHNTEREPYFFDIEERRKSSAADNFLTTVGDLGSLGISVLKKTGLTNEVYAEMIKPRSKVRKGVAFGLGWLVFEDLENGEYALLNAGSDKGVNAIILLLPKSKRGLIALTNGDGGRKIVMQLIGRSLDVGNEILSRL
ncbi:MAG: serine hydrolase domain-containing protein [Bacteroidota bacterium]